MCLSSDLFEFTALMMEIASVSETSVCFWHRYKKGKAVPLRSIEAHLGNSRYSSYSFLTSALERGEWSASRPGGPLPPVPIVQEVGWAPEPVWTQRLEGKSRASIGDQTPTVHSAVRHYTDWATPVLLALVQRCFLLVLESCGTSWRLRHEWFYIVSFLEFWP
jgi:hypothetical protein